MSTPESQRRITIWYNNSISRWEPLRTERTDSKTSVPCLQSRTSPTTAQRQKHHKVHQQTQEQTDCGTCPPVEYHSALKREDIRTHDTAKLIAKIRKRRCI